MPHGGKQKTQDKGKGKERDKGKEREKGKERDRGNGRDKGKERDKGKQRADSTPSSSQAEQVFGRTASGGNALINDLLSESSESSSEGPSGILELHSASTDRSSDRSSASPSLRLAQAPARPDPAEVQADLNERAARLDYDLLTELHAKVGLVGRLNTVAGNEPPSARLQLKQLVLFSALPVARLTRLVDAAAAKPKHLATLRSTLLKGKMRSSGEVTLLIDQCRNLVGDYFRGQAAERNGAGATTDDLVREARTYDASGDGSLDASLTHQETTRDRLHRKHTVTVDHTLEEVMDKVRLVAAADIGATSSPQSLPAVAGQLDAAPTRARVGVVGGGPVGLLAALEARRQGAEVVLFEARSDEYSRRQVLALDASTRQRLARYGVAYDLLQSGTTGEHNVVAVKYIEKALRTRALELGIELRSGWSLVGASRDDGESQTTASFQIGRGDKAKQRAEALDLLVVAAGPGVARANKYTGACIADELGISYTVQEAKDYAAVGLFEPTTQGGFTPKDEGRWAYRFNTPKVTYLLRQIPPELMSEFSDPGGQKKLEAFLLDRATNHFRMGARPTLAKSHNKHGQPTPNIAVFPIEIQQATSFVNEKLAALVIGDSAATPHPHSGSGFNTGVRELDALADVVASVQAQVAAATASDSSSLSEAMSDSESSDTEDDRDESPQQVTAALRDYNAQMKQITDVMVAKGLKVLATQHGTYLREAVKDLQDTEGPLLAANYALGQQVESIRVTAAAALAPDSGWDVEDTLELLLDSQQRLATIRRQLSQLRAAHNGASDPTTTPQSQGPATT